MVSPAHVFCDVLDLAVITARVRRSAMVAAATAVAAAAASAVVAAATTAWRGTAAASTGRPTAGRRAATRANDGPIQFEWRTRFARGIANFGLAAFPREVAIFLRTPIRLRVSHASVVRA